MRVNVCVCVRVCVELCANVDTCVYACVYGCASVIIYVCLRACVCVGSPVMENSVRAHPSVENRRFEKHLADSLLGCTAWASIPCSTHVTKVLNQ